MAAGIDEPVEVVAYDSQWPQRFALDAAEIMRVLGRRVRELQHFGSTAVPGLSAKPIIDILVAPAQWPLVPEDSASLLELGYEHLGEAGVPGREYFRRRGEHATNLAVVEWNSRLWRDNLLLRDYFRSHAEAAGEYGCAKRRKCENGAITLLAYSASKASLVAAALESARRWRGPAHQPMQRPGD